MDTNGTEEVITPLEADNVAADEPDNYDKMRKVDLEAMLERRGLRKSGRKADLVERLKASDNGTLPKAKKSTKATSADIKIDGPLARDVIVYQDSNPTTGEKRLRPFVENPDVIYITKLKKIREERMFMLDRKRGHDKENYPQEEFDIAGSTGNVYQTIIGRKPFCTCMDARMRGQKCKHINYALIIILQAPAYMCYQLAFLSNEIDEMFANAPITRASVQNHSQQFDALYNGKRKPVDGECPICVFAMEPGDDLVWCKAACGQNFHKDCFEQWRRSKNGEKVTCPYCRTEWQEESDGSLASLTKIAPKIGSYRNIGHLSIYQQADR